jgi:hypothetical protein
MNTIDTTALFNQIPTIDINVNSYNRNGFESELHIDTFTIFYKILGGIDTYSRLKGDEYETRLSDRTWVEVDAIMDDEGEEMEGYDKETLEQLIKESIEWEY